MHTIIRGKQRRDDGYQAQVASFSGPIGRPVAKCPDCGPGVLQWAEANYVPWHRICDHCGSHFRLEPTKETDFDGSGTYRLSRARFY